MDSAPEPQICLGTICGGSVRVEYLHGLVESISTRASRVGRVLIEPSGPYLDDARNQVVASFLSSTQLRYLLFVDSDIMFSAADITTLLAHLPDDQSIVSGAYRTQRDNGSYVVAADRDQSGILAMIPVSDFPGESDGGGLRRVDGVGAGFLLIPRPILVDLRDHYPAPCPWFVEPVDDHGVHLGEDYGFCDRVTKLGYSIYLDPTVKLTHVKSIGLTL